MQYILKLSIALAVVYLFYWLLLRRLTFYNWNRWYLLGYSLCCFFIPLINVFELLQQHGLQDAAVVSYIPAITVVDEVVAAKETGINWWMVYMAVLTAGSVLMLGRLLVQFLSLKRLQSSAVLLSDGSVKLYHVDKNIIPFSTRSAIYVNRHLHNEHELKEIIHHEFIHVKQRHSVDLWWSEILCILNWYNPFAWLIRKAIRQNLEFIADHQVLQSGLDRKQYQYLLLKVTGIAPFSMASNFNFSSLKKRIAMMNKNKSANIHLMRFLFILPLLVVVLLAFRSVAVSNLHYTEKKQTDTIPPPPPPKVATIQQKGVKPPPPPPAPVVAPKPGRASALPESPAPAAAPGEAAPVAAPHAVPGVPAKPKAPVKTPVPVAAPASGEAPAPVKVQVSGSATITNVHVGGSAAAVADVQPVSPVKFVVADEVTVHAKSAKNPRTVLTADVIELSPVAVSGTEEKSLLLEIYNTTTQAELEQMTRLLQEKGFALALSKVQFENGLLVSLEGTVSNGSTKGWFSGDHFKAITIMAGKQNTNNYYVTVKGGSVSLKN